MTTPSDPRKVIEILLAAIINSQGAFECPVCNKGDRGLACDDGHADDCWLAEAMGSDEVDEAIWLDSLFGNGDRDDPSEHDGPPTLAQRLDDHGARIDLLTVGLDEVRERLGIAPCGMTPRPPKQTSTTADPSEDDDIPF